MRSRKWKEIVNKTHKQHPKKNLFDNTGIFFFKYLLNKTHKKNIDYQKYRKTSRNSQTERRERKKIITKNINCTAVKQANTWMKLTL